MKGVIFFLAFSLFVPAVAQLDVSGSAIDERGHYIPNVVIKAKGLAIGTQTDDYGNFTLKIPADTAILIITYPLLLTQTLNVVGNAVIELILHEEPLDDSNLSSWTNRMNRKPISRDKTRFTTNLVYEKKPIFIGGKFISKMAQWRVGEYKILIPLDSLWNSLEYSNGRLDNILYALNYLRSNSNSDTVVLSDEFLTKVGIRRLNDLAVEMIKINAITIIGMNNIPVKQLISIDSYWYGGKKFRNACWGGISFYINENESPLFVETWVIC